jgi:hypothetical protein
MIFFGKNKDFNALFDTKKQVYVVYYKGNVLTKKYKFSDIKGYLN